MNNLLLESLPGLVDFCKYFGGAIGFVLLFCMIYCKITPYSELQLIRRGNTSAAISFGGALLGFVLPLSSAISHSVGFIDMLVWSIVAMLMQFAVFGTVRILFKGLVRDIENDHTAAAIMMSFSSVSIGILNAACMTY